MRGTEIREPSAVDRFGLENVYVLSASWGLIRADFLTPYYDITFSSSADAYKIKGYRLFSLASRAACA
jgi:hypothetical protein